MKNKSLLVFFKDFLLLVIFAVMIKPSLVLATDNGYVSPQGLSNINQWEPVLDSKLAALRGGFVLPNGIIVNISFEKQVFQNGIETFNSYFQSPENLALVKNGEFNIASKLDNSMIQSVIQNNLDNQTLHTINTINIDIENLNKVIHTFSTNELYQFLLPNPNAYH